MDTRIYVMTHKQFIKPADDLYISLQVGRALHEDLGYVGDHTGDNISEKNKNYCELTGLYWLWKNIRCDYIGICHYRRYFVHQEEFLTKEYIEKTLAAYDMIVPTDGLTEYGSVKEQYAQVHYLKDLRMCREIIAERCPGYLSAFDRSAACNLVSLGNMFIAPKKMFDAYCAWLFEILFVLEERTDISSYDEYQARIMGFLSERLFRVWLLNHAYRIKEEEVRMIDPKDCDNAVKAVSLKYQYIRLLLKPLLLEYQRENFYDVVDNAPLAIDFEGKMPVWVFWAQGEKEAPELVRMCLESIRRNTPQEKAEVCLITFENIGQFITLPQWILDKFEQGLITITHFSDILRAGLLYRYGGMWIDATYYMAKPLPDRWYDWNSFDTLRLAEAPWKADIVQGRWAGNLMKCEPGNLLMRFLLNAFYEYWRNQEQMIDYYLIDYIIALAYDNLSCIKRMIESCPCSQPQVFSLAKLLNTKYDPVKWEEITKDTQVFKLSYKSTLVKKNIVGENTFFGRLTEEFGEGI